jgi:hypothetical protein
MTGWPKIREGIITVWHCLLDFDTKKGSRQYELIVNRREQARRERIKFDQRKKIASAKISTSQPERQNEATPLPLPISDNPQQGPEPDLPPFHRGDTEDRKIRVAELILIKKKWDIIDAQLQELRDQGRILPGIRENAKANMILEVESGVSCYDAVSLHAPNFIAPVWTPHADDAPQPQTKTRPISGCFWVALVVIGIIAYYTIRSMFG